MKFVTLQNGTPDGRLHIAAPDGTRVEPASNVATMQEALESWDTNAAIWDDQYRALAADTRRGTAYQPQQGCSPLPRAWQWLDGSAFETHMLLMQKAWNLPETGLSPRPLMYQGMSHIFLPPTAAAVFPSVDDGIDFEGEYGVIVGAVPMGTKAGDAAQYIRLVVLINDWSLRSLGPIEMATGFGWLQCKPACSVAPFAVTPDELGDGWRNNRVCLPLEIHLNKKLFGRANGQEMKFGFDELIAHAAYSRDLPAGTIIGSGTVANTGYEDVGSSCIAERRAIEQIRTGEAQTPFLQQGDHVTMTATRPDGTALFGTIDQKVSIVS